MDALDLREVVLVANDTGGPAAFGAAASAPERFAGLVALSTFAFSLKRVRSVRFMLRLVTSAPFRWLNRRFNALPRLAVGPGVRARTVLRAASDPC